jgi:hypothetical protein
MFLYRVTEWLLMWTRHFWIEFEEIIDQAIELCYCIEYDEGYFSQYSY